MIIWAFRRVSNGASTCSVWIRLGRQDLWYSPLTPFRRSGPPDLDGSGINHASTLFSRQRAALNSVLVNEIVEFDFEEDGTPTILTSLGAFASRWPITRTAVLEASIGVIIGNIGWRPLSRRDSRAE